MPMLKNDDSLPKLPDNFSLGSVKPLTKEVPVDEELADLEAKINAARKLREEKIAQATQPAPKVEVPEPVEMETVPQQIPEPTLDLERAIVILDQRLTAVEAALLRIRGAI